MNLYQLGRASFIIFGFVLIAPLSSLTAQDNAHESNHADGAIEEIENILKVQADAWNDDDIEGFMGTYWKSESLTFSSGGKTTRGWQATLDGYKRRYPAGKMGDLTFDHLETSVLSESSALVLGQWHLVYPDRKMDGNFSLVLKKLEGEWKIVHDHSSIIEDESAEKTESSEKETGPDHVDTV